MAQQKFLFIAVAGAMLLVSGWVAIPAFAQSAATRNELWPELDTYIRLNEKSRLFFTYSSTRKDNLEVRSNWQVAGGLDIYFRRLIDHKDRQHPDAARKRTLLVRTAYYYSPTPAKAPQPLAQHIPTVLADTRFSLPGKMMLDDRNRFDLRFVNGDFSPRYRNRITIERPFKTGRFEIAPYLRVEAFYDWKYDAFNRMRYSTGVDWTATTFLVLESYYTRQRDTKSSPEYINALGVTLQLHLR